MWGGVFLPREDRWVQAAERLLRREGWGGSLRQGDWCKDVARVEWDVMVAWTHGHPELQRR